MTTTLQPRVQRITSKGQLTLPAQWRNKYTTDEYKVEASGNKLVVTPLQNATEREEEWETIWDAKRDNHGKGIEAGEFLKMLDEVRAEKGW